MIFCLVMSGWLGVIPRVRLFQGLGPDYIVGAVEGDEHQAGFLGLAGEPVHDFAGHPGEAGEAEDFFGHAVHAG